MSTQAQKKFRILLIGDVCTDEYQYGTVERLSPEAPVPVFKLGHKETKPGMAANVQINLMELGAEVAIIGGDKSTKTRLIDSKSKQQIVRIDNDVIISSPLIFSAIPPELLQLADAVIFSDYNKGLVSYELIEQTRKVFEGPIFIDTKKQDLSRFDGCFVKINESEYKARYSINNQLIVTLGERGAMYKQFNDEKFFETAQVDIVDVCGAGDTFLAALALEYLRTNSIEDAIVFANKAATVTIQHVGVYAPGPEEIK